VKTLAFGLGMLAFGTLLHAETVLYFSVDTSGFSLPGTDAFIDFQYSELVDVSGPGVTAYNSTGTATIDNFFINGGSLVSEDPYTTSNAFGSLTSGDVTGTLPADVTLSEEADGATNIYDQELTLGTSLNFTLILDGQDVTTPICPGTSGTECSFPAFIFDIYTNSGEFLLTNDPTGSTPYGWIAGGVNINADTTVSSFTNPAPDGSASLTDISSAPEPGGAAMMMVGGLAILMFFRTRFRKRAKVLDNRKRSA